MNLDVLIKPDTSEEWFLPRERLFRPDEDSNLAKIGRAVTMHWPVDFRIGPCFFTIMLFCKKSLLKA